MILYCWDRTVTTEKYLNYNNKIYWIMCLYQCRCITKKTKQLEISNTLFSNKVTIILIICEKLAHGSSQILLCISLASSPSVDKAFLVNMRRSGALSDWQLLLVRARTEQSSVQSFYFSAWSLLSEGTVWSERYIFTDSICFQK